MDVNIFPNPTTSSFNLQVLTAAKEQVKVRIMDIQGRLFKTITVSPYQQTTFGSELKAGTYVIEITQGKQKSVQQLVKL
ncbi:MAG: T9SS type A sorting domain-containing protein [Ferruginibacter sp.]